MLALAIAVTLAGMPSAAATTAEDCRNGMAAARADPPRSAEAVEKLGRCIDRAALPPPFLAYALQMHALSLDALGRTAEAADEMQRAIQLVPPQDVYPWVALADLRRRLHRYEDALDALSHARTLDEDGPGTGPGMAVGFHTAWTLADMGRHRDAIAAITAALPRQPLYGPAFARRAYSYEALGDTEHARADLERAAALVAPNDRSAEMKAALVRLHVDDGHADAGAGPVAPAASTSKPDTPAPPR